MCRRSSVAKAAIKARPQGAIALLRHLRRLPFKIDLGFGVSPKWRNKAIAPYKNVGEVGLGLTIAKAL
jgi:hypothetical protein